MLKQENQNIAALLSFLIEILLAAFLTFFSLYNPKIIPLLVSGGSNGLFLPLLWIYLAVIVIYVFMFKLIRRMNNEWTICFSLFFLAFIPRFILFCFQVYVPTNDFFKYYMYGQNMFYGKYNEIAHVISTFYQMPKMGGIAIYFGLIAKLFSPHLMGYQIANMITTSLISVTLYKIVKKHSKEIALIAALLFALYPSNIVSTQITSNQHGATLFFLIAILFYCKALQNLKTYKGYIYAILSAIFITVSNFIHPSVIIVILSIICYTFLIAIEQWKKEKKFLNSSNKKMAGYIIIIIISYLVFSTGGLRLFHAMGVINDYQEVTILHKVVMGLNPETKGGYSGSDMKAIKAFPPSDEQTQFCVSLIKERITNPKELIKLMITKSNTAWFERDGYFYWYTEGKMNHFTEMKKKGVFDDTAAKQQEQIKNIVAGAKYLDIFFVRIVFAFTIIGILIKKVRRVSDVSNIMVFIILGWIAFIALTEMQSRYRYPTMPCFMIMAAIGLKEFCNKIVSIYETRKVKL